MLDTHTQKNLVINSRELKHHGIFRVDELFAITNLAMGEKGYTKREKKTEELVTTTGKQTYVELRPYKELSNYITLMIKIKITLDDVKEAVESVKGKRRKFQDGDVSIIFDSWVLTDYEYRWGMKPFFYFIKGVINKFVYTFPIESDAPGEVASDTAYIYAQIKKLLNSYTSKAEEIPVYEKIRKQIEKDIRKEIKESKKEK